MHVQETLQEISSHMGTPPAAWEKETCGHVGEMLGLHREGSMEKEGSTMHYREFRLYR